MSGLRNDWNYTNVPDGVRQIHQGMYGTVTHDEMHVSEPYPDDHLEAAELLANYPILDRLEALICLHPEFDVHLLEHLVHLVLVKRAVADLGGQQE